MHEHTYRIMHQQYETWQHVIQTKKRRIAQAPCNASCCHVFRLFIENCFNYRHNNATVAYGSTKK